MTRSWWGWMGVSVASCNPNCQVVPLNFRPFFFSSLEADDWTATPLLPRARHPGAPKCGVLFCSTSHLSFQGEGGAELLK